MTGEIVVRRRRALALNYTVPPELMRRPSSSPPASSRSAKSATRRSCSRCCSRRASASRCRSSPASSWPRWPTTPAPPRSALDHARGRPAVDALGARRVVPRRGRVDAGARPGRRRSKATAPAASACSASPWSPSSSPRWATRRRSPPSCWPRKYQSLWRRDGRHHARHDDRQRARRAARRPAVKLAADALGAPHRRRGVRVLACWCWRASEATLALRAPGAR